MLMTRIQCDFYLDRLSLFLRPAEIARRLGVTQTAVNAWLKKLGTPKLTYLPMFEDAFCELLDQIEKKGFPEISIALDTERPTGSKSSNYSPDAVLGWLKARMIDGKPVRYLILLSEGRSRKFTRSQISYAGRKLGVTRELRHAKDGKKAYSLWRLVNDA